MLKYGEITVPDNWSKDDCPYVDWVNCPKVEFCPQCPFYPKPSITIETEDFEYTETNQRAYHKPPQ